jgi:hypothetical protein
LQTARRKPYSWCGITELEAKGKVTDTELLKTAKDVPLNYDNVDDVIHEDGLFNIRKAWLYGVAMVCGQLTATVAT